MHGCRRLLLGLIVRPGEDFDHQTTLKGPTVYLSYIKNDVHCVSSTSRKCLLESLIEEPFEIGRPQLKGSHKMKRYSTVQIKQSPYKLYPKDITTIT
jgi:hypothetical protein